MVVAMQGPRVLLPAALAAAVALPAVAADFRESSDLRTRVDKLVARAEKLSKSDLKSFYGVKYRDGEVASARHQCYLALVDQVNLKDENKRRIKDLKFVTGELRKLREGYGKLAGLSADEVQQCEERRTESCERLLRLPDDHQARYFRSEIDILRDDARSVQEAITAHERMAAEALDQCKDVLSSLG